MDSRSTSIQMLVTYLVILAVCLQRVQSTCGGYTQEQCADSSTMHQFKRCVHKVFHACLKRHPLKRDPHGMNVERDPNGMNVERDPNGMNAERDPHGMNVERDPHGMNVERDPHGMNMERDPNRTPVLCHTIVYVWKKERFCHVKCFWLKYKVPHIHCEKK
uniref:Cnidarian restricted protein n=1 Tax=Clytia hemisphaerica TaxID=252671 RepID=A0A7M5U6B7_9CNID